MTWLGNDEALFPGFYLIMISEILTVFSLYTRFLMAGKRKSVDLGWLGMLVQALSHEAIYLLK